MRSLGARLTAVLAVALAVAGCQCTGPQAERKLTVSIIDPTDGATLDVGAQVSVVVQAKAENLSTGESSDFEPAGGTLQIDDVDSGLTATLATGKLTFSWTAPTPGSYRLRVVGVTEKDSALDPASSQTVNVVVNKDVTAPEVTQVLIEKDANGDGALNLTESPAGTPIVVKVSTVGLEDGQPVVVRQAPSGTVYGEATATGGQTSVTLGQMPSTLEASYQMVVEVTDKAGNKNKTSGTPPLNDKAFFSLAVDRLAPTVSMTVPTKALLGLSDDDDGTKAGFQLRVVAQSADTDVSRIDVSFDGKQGTCSAQTCMANGVAVMTLDLAVPGTRSSALAVTAYDAAGNEGTASKSVTVDFDLPTVQVTSPLASGGPYTSFSQTLTAMVADPNGAAMTGQLVTFYRVAPPSTAEVQIGQAAVGASGVATTTATFTNGTFNIVAKVSDVAGNPAVPAVESGVVINSTACDVQITAPPTKPAYLTKSNDIDSVTPNLQFIVRAHSATCPTTVITLYVDNANPQPTLTNSSGDAQWQITLLNGTATVRVDINNTAGGPTSDSVQITVDQSTPAITIPSNNTLLRVVDDAQRQTPGVQALLSFTATVPGGARADICANANLGGALTACADGATGWWTLKQAATSPDSAFSFPDGAYSIKPVLVVGSSANVGAAVAITADSTRPTTTSVTIVGDGNGDKRLNVAELAGQPPQLIITTSEPATVLVRDQVSGTTYMTAAASTGANNTVTVSLNKDITTSEADYQLAIVVTDAHTNTNVLANPTSADPLDSLALLSLRVDKVPPSCSFTAPTKSLLGTADDANTSRTGFQLGTTVSTTASDARNAVFSLTGAQTGTATIVFAGGVAGTQFDVLSTGSNAYSLSAVCSDQSGNTTSSQLALNPVTIDLVVPTCNITAPTGGSTWGAFGVTTTVSTTGVPVTTQVKIFTTQTSRTQAGTLLTDGSGVATGVVTYPNGAQSIDAEVTSAAGNKGTCGPVAITVNAVGCPITLSTPTSSSFLNRSQDVNGGTPTVLDFSVTGDSVSCTGKTVTIYETSSGQTLLGTGTTDSWSHFSISVSLSEGVHAITAVIDNGSGVTNQTTASNVTVDLTPPTVGAVTPSGSTLFFVSATNAHLPPAVAVAESGYIVDGTPGGDADATVAVSNVSGAAGGYVTVRYQGNAVGGTPLQVSAGLQSFTIPILLPQATSGDLVVEVQDQAGNVIQPVNATTKVDVLAPDAPTLTQTLGNSRTATVNLSWTAANDDAASPGSGAVAGYDIRWTFNAIKDANGNQTAAMTEADYWSSSKAKQEIMAGPGVTAHTATLPPMATYYIAIRAVDDVQNYSTFVAPPSSGLPNLGNRVTFSQPAGQQYSAFMASRGSLNNDAVDDLVVSSAGAAGGGAVYVYFGGTGLATQSDCTGTACQKITPYAGSAAVNFGAVVAVGNVASITKPAVVVSDWGFNASSGRVFIYPGTASAATLDTSTPVILCGDAATAFGRSVQVLPDLDNPTDGFAELAVSAPSANSNRGIVYIFKGRSGADWVSASTATDGNRACVPTSTALKYTIDGPSPVETGGNQFGRYQNGFAFLGDLDADGSQDFAVPASKDSACGNKLYLLSGLTVRTKGSVQVGACNSKSADVLQLLGFSTGTYSNNLLGFGNSAVGAVSSIGGASNGLVVGYGDGSRVMLFGNPTTLGFPTNPVVSIMGSSLMGSALAVADLNGDSAPDIITAEGLTSANSTWVFYGRAGSFDNQAGTGFAQSRLVSPSPGALGSALVVGDFNGDGRPDLAMGDYYDSPARVTIWY